jgi:hypothetical protein
MRRLLRSINLLASSALIVSIAYWNPVAMGMLGIVGFISAAWANLLERQAAPPTPALPAACVHGRRRRRGNVIPIEAYQPCPLCSRHLTPAEANVASCDAGLHS